MPTPFRSSYAAILRLFLFLGAGMALSSAGCQGNSAPAFNADRAFTDLKKQVDFGPRVPGTPAHDACGKYLLGELKASAASVEEQRFTERVGSKTLPMTNIIARFNPTAPRRLLLLAHWDTRPIADHDLEPSRRNQPIPGANDGASGVAVLLELARQFKQSAPRVGVTILLVDGEDYGRSDAAMFFGSRYFARHIGNERYDGAILLDMVGDKDLKIYREGNSDNNAKSLNDRIWQTAGDLGYRTAFPDEAKYTIEDDHLPLQQIGIPAIDLIDFDYAYWHTTEDTPDKCSPQSLRAVGDVVSGVVYAF